ncbi:MAG: hypothetical protein IT440_12070 [Phycisphaeraceae bacterium]|nr:hypothetical protein [Phycisphaeraceae bacterium]
MTSQDGAYQVVDALNRLGIAYMLVGSFSSNAYGTARATGDADFVIETDQRIDDLRRALQPHFRMDSQISFEPTQGTTRYLFHHDGTGFLVEVFVLSDDEHDRARFSRRRSIERGGRVAYFPSPEDVIIQKLRWGRRKDQADVAGILALQKDKLDWTYLRLWCDRHGTRALLDAIVGDPTSFV